MKEKDIQEDVDVLNELLDDEIVPRLHRKYRNALEEIMEEVNKDTCVYEQIEEDENLWRCNKCECIWCLEEGSPEKNNMNYCPECGSRITKNIEFEEDEDED